MLTPADGQSGRKPRGRRAWLEEPNRVADAGLPQQHPVWEDRSPGAGEGSLGLPRDTLVQGHPSALSCPSVGLLQGRNLSKVLTAPWD